MHVVIGIYLQWVSLWTQRFGLKCRHSALYENHRKIIGKEMNSFFFADRRRKQLKKYLQSCPVKDDRLQSCPAKHDRLQSCPVKDDCLQSSQSKDDRLQSSPAKDNRALKSTNRSIRCWKKGFTWLVVCFP